MSEVVFHIPDTTRAPFKGAKKGDSFHPNIPIPADPYNFNLTGPAEYIACGFNSGKPCSHWNHVRDGIWYPPPSRKRHWWS